MSACTIYSSYMETTLLVVALLSLGARKMSTGIVFRVGKEIFNFVIKTMNMQTVFYCN